MIVDAFLYAGEVKMAELRLRTLDSVVDAFTAVVCTHTHQGQPTDLPPFADLMVRFPKLHLYVVEPSMQLVRHGDTYTRRPEERGPARTPWFQHIERQHRDGVTAAVCDIPGVDDRTMVMVSDVDEIPLPVTVATFDRLPMSLLPWRTCAQRFHSTALEYLVPHQPWYGTCVARLATLTPQAMRDARATVGTPERTIAVVGHGGWHFSWFGTDAQRQRKLDTFSHAELRGTFDPVDARANHMHADGLPLQRCAFPGRFDWPEPLLNGTFNIPESWHA